MSATAMRRIKFSRLLVAPILAVALIVGQPTEGFAAGVREPIGYAPGRIVCSTNTNTNSRSLQVHSPSMAGIKGDLSTWVYAVAWYRLSWDNNNWGSWTHYYTYWAQEVPLGNWVDWLPGVQLTRAMPDHGRPYYAQVDFSFFWYDAATRRWDTREDELAKYAETWVDYSILSTAACAFA
jgi:hypothetical protein